MWPSPTGVRAAYGQSTAYSLTALVSYIETYGEPNLFMVFLGDHPPAPIVSGEGAVRDVPVAIVARPRSPVEDLAVGLERRPTPGRHRHRLGVDEFHDQFLSAYGG